MFDTFLSQADVAKFGKFFGKGQVVHVLAGYLATWQYVLASVTKSNAPDYMAATGVLWVAAQKL